MSDSETDRDHEPTQKKLDEARRRGEIPRSADANAALVYAGFWAALALFGGGACLSFAGVARRFLAEPDRLAGALAGQPARLGPAEALGGTLLALTWPVLPVLLLPGGVVLVGLLAQRAIVFAPSRLAPRAARISPVATARQKFGVSGLVEFAKQAIKAGLIACLLWMFLRGRLGDLLVAPALSPGQGAQLLGTAVVGVAALLAGLAGVIGAADMLWQRHDFRRRNRMSRQEVIDEYREAEGDPHIKGQRQQRAREIATNRMLQDVPGADVVIVNPTHYAVALRWRRGNGRAPVCVAKGVDEIAARIRERAAASGVPIRSDPPVARRLHAEVEIGQEIRPEHYAPVAAAIRFAAEMRKRAQARQGGRS